MDRLKTIWSWLGRRAQNVLALLLLTMFVAFLLQIVFRYFLNLPVGWTVEWVAIAWLWGILFGYAFVVRETEVIHLDVLYDAMPRGVRRGFDVITGVFVAAVFAWTLPATWDYVDFMKIERTAYLRWPFNFVFFIYIPFAIAVIVRALMTAWAGLTGTGPRFHIQDSAGSHDYD
ncbi:TRAP transporter small permease [Sinisalibacter aestuarii]|uniref:TRAP transporter small permease protein n=1 Tax=Sinisalibacter aestuarii TaxID=2949426 RepID=A0ABQ5LND4_9RHOB|nr:TRAP transporter small permease subunit [Sinisalibacter aestuarii]GKY86517.1 C4-dicarboxylate ABC transporter permease [Sinisalibacter aestuarii]